jgi:hypothetical protein
MRNPPRVRILYRSGDFARNPEHLIQRQWASFQTIGERLAFEILHHQKVHAVLRADVVQRADVRMLQAGDCLRLAIQSLLQFRVGGQVRGENFHRDGTIEAGIARAIDFPHATGPDRCLNLVGSQPGASGQWHEAEL